ncbi:hypothetical protein [Mesorhizobium marinum]|uniref:mannitol dehydrogenase family protein n=1 Tax=Mesorhizobium marinum TaxID=3228790 RepID=UPI003467DD72
MPGMQVGPYLDLTLARLGNRAIRHTNHQIATDGSQKINQRILQPLRDRRALGLASPLLETAIAGWVAYLAKSQPAFGGAWQAHDQIMPLVADIATRSSGDIDVFTKLFIGNRAIFGDSLAADDGLADRIAGTAKAMLADGVRTALGRAMAEAPPRG